MLVPDCDQVRQLLDPGELAEALRTAFRSISDDSGVAAAGRGFTPGGLLGTMPGYVPDVGFGAKLLTYFRNNHNRGVPGHQALVAHG
jgi:hypothetical protein